LECLFCRPLTCLGYCVGDAQGCDRNSQRDHLPFRYEASRSSASILSLDMPWHEPVKELV
jgi:hypothetical protein